MQELQQRQYEITNKIEGQVEDDKAFQITLKALLSLCSNSYEIFESSKNEQKRKLINFMFSNLKLNGDKLEYDLRSPFHLMQNVGNYEEWLARLDTIRTKHLGEVLIIKTMLPAYSQSLLLSQNGLAAR